MKTLLSILLSSALLSAANVSICDSGCDHPTAQLQTYLDAAACGDHIQLKAQVNPYPAVYLNGGNSVQCGANPRYFENFDMAHMPPVGVMMFPAYAPLLPNVQTSSGEVLYTHNGGTDCGGGTNHCPANGWVIQGLAFTESASRLNSSCFIVFGQFDSSCSSDTAVIVQADMPTNITFQRNYVQTNPKTVTRRCMDLNFYLGTVRDNWVDCISPTLLDGNAGDSQVLAGGPVGTASAHVLITNNMLIGGTETVAWGAYPSVIQTPVGVPGWLASTTVGANYVDLIGNHIQHDPYQITANWTASTYYRIGQAVVSSGGSLPIFIALTSGKTAGSEPNWAGTGIGSTVVDGGVTWWHPTNLWNNGACSNDVKNHFESKSMLNAIISNNFLDRLWPDCASGGNQGRSLVPEVQTSTNGGGAASNLQNVAMDNNIGTNLSGAFGSLFTLSFDDPNRFARFFSSNIEPYNITSGNHTLNVSVDGGAGTTITLTNGAARTALQIANEINTAAVTNVVAAAYDPIADSTAACTTSSTTCHLVLTRATGVNLNAPYFTSDSFQNPWNSSGVAISIGLATGTTATSVLGLPANGTNITECTNPITWVWYACGQGANVALRNNVFQLRHDGHYAPYVPTVALIDYGVDGFTFDHNLLNDPAGWSGIPQLINTPALEGADLVGHLGARNVLIQNNTLLDNASYVGSTDGPAHVDWSGINYGCQAAVLNAAMTTGGAQNAECDAAHTKGGFTHNLSYGVGFTNSGVGDTCTVAIIGSGGAKTCDTTSADGNHGNLAQPNDNFNADHFSSLVFRQATPANDAQPDYALVYNPSSPQKYVQAANFGNDNRPIGPDMTQTNFIRLAGGAPVVSDRAAIFTIQPTPILQGKEGQLIVATDPFCFNPVPDMDPSLFTNPGWTGNDAFPILGSIHQVVVGLNSPLAASTKYYYCIHYGGYEIDGNFTTLATLAGTTTQGANFAPPSNLIGAAGTSEIVLNYGTSYSRATDTISGGGTTTAVGCTLGGGPCAATAATATKGAPLYWRWQLRNSGHTVVKQAAVNVGLPQ